MGRRRKSSMKCARKWHKSPHNRFKVPICMKYKQPLILIYYDHKKQQQQQNHPRSHQKQIVTYGAELRNEDSTSVVLDKSSRKLNLILLITFFSLLGASSFATSDAEQQVVSTATSSTSQVLNLTQTKEQPQQIPLKLFVNKSSTKQQTTTPATVTVTATSAHRPFQNDQVKQFSSLPPNVTSLPAKLEEEVELSRATLSRRRQRQPRIYKLSTNPLNGKLSLPLRIDLSDGLLSRPHNKRPAIVAVDNKMGVVATTQTTQAPFGTRAQKSGNVVVSSSVNETTEACNPEQQEQGSIATSSQTLRLTKVERPTMIQVKPSLRAGSQITPSESSPGEVEEFSGRGAAAEIDTLERAQPTLIATPASPISGSSRRLGTTIGQQAASNNIRAETSLEESTTQSTPSSSFGNSENNEQINSNSIFSLIDEYDSKIVTNRTKAQLSCDSGEMILRLNFSEPFKGIVYPDHNRLSPCRFFGDGHHNYELRLPLRGCGTRQAAPRVFVNDVIVRFHKALELEEDEVKTLICRYPPPLAPVPLENGSLTFGNPPSSSNKQAFGNYGDRASNSRPTTLDQANNSNSEQESQFEFIDSLNGRLGNSNNKFTGNNLPEPGTTGQIETLSENLVVAPPIGQQINYGQQISPDLTSNPNSLLNNQFNTKQLSANNNNLKRRPDFLPEQPIDIFNQRNSIVNQNGFPETHNSIKSGSGSGQASANAQSYFERLSSIELLFLISSLMFLILLALGLVGSYYCFRRQVSRSKQNRASAILKRKHRYLNSLDHRHSHGATLISPPTILQPQTGHKYNSSQHNTGHLRFPNHTSNHHSHHVHPHSHPHPQPHHSKPYNHYQLPQAHHHQYSTASPSPDSDLSGTQNLLESKGGSQRFSSGQDNRGFIFNASSYVTPDNQYQTSQYNRAANQFNSRANGHSGNNNHYTSSSRSRQIPPNLVNQTTVGGILVKQPPVVGRRGDSNAQQYGYICTPSGQTRDIVVSDRQQRHVSPKTIVQYPSNKSHKWPPNFSDTSQAQLNHDGPLLAMATSSGSSHPNELIGNEPEYSNINRSLRFKDLNGSNSKVAIGVPLIPAKYAFVNKARAKLASGHRGRSQLGERENSDYNHGQSHAQLWRAKSLSAVNKEEARARWQQQKMAASGTIIPLGGTLSRHEHSGGRNNYRRRQVDGPGSSFGGFQSILSEERARLDDAKYSSRVATGKGLLMKDVATNIDLTDDDNDDDDESFINDNGEEVCEQNNNISEILMHDKPMGNIVLKSIEDAYITNFTEIYEQEFMKRDSTRPLALNEWRAMQPRAKINPSGKTAGTTSVHVFGRRNNESESSEPGGIISGGKLVSTQTTSDEDDEEQRYQSTGATNLRSLTELDVNFARSLPTLTATPTGSPLKSAASADRLVGIDDELDDGCEGYRKRRSSSVPEVGVGGEHGSDREKDSKHILMATKSPSLVTGRNPEAKQNRPESPDLILSPDYNYNRLEFEPPGEASKSSHNSVSYV